MAAATRLCRAATRNVAKRAGAAPLAGSMQEPSHMAGNKVGPILCGGNIDTGGFKTVPGGQTPTV